MAEVASAFVSLMPSARGFGRATEQQVGGELDSAGKKVGSKFGAALKVGALGVLAGGALLAGFAGRAIGEAREAQKVGAITAQIIKTTGGVANVTAGQVESLATAISNKTGIDDEAIQTGSNLLLTFKNVRNEVGKGNAVFDRATQAAVDLSAAGFGSIDSASKSLGKALNDPVKGIAALNRAGVTFTKQQENQIEALVKSGDTLKAQKIILAEVESQVGGTAAASATAGDKFKVAFGNFAETVGTALLPAVDKALGVGTDLVLFLTNNVGPAVSSVAGFIKPAADAIQGLFSANVSGSALTGAIEGIVATFRPFAESVLPVLLDAGKAILSALLPAFQGIASVVSSQLVPAFQRILPVVAPVVNFLVTVLKSAVVGAIQGIAQAVRGIIAVISGVFNLIAALVQGDWSAVWAALKQIVVGAVNAVIGVIKAWLNIGILAIFRKAGLAIVKSWRGLWDGLKGLSARAGAALQGLAGRLLSGILRLFTGYVRLVAAVWRGLFSALRGLAAAGWRFLTGLFRGALEAIKRLVSSAWQALRNLFAKGWDAVKQLTGRAWDAIKGAVSKGITALLDLVKSIPGRVKTALGNLGQTLYNAGQALIQGLINGINSRIAALRDKISELKNLIPDLNPFNGRAASFKSSMSYDLAGGGSVPTVVIQALYAHDDEAVGNAILKAQAKALALAGVA